MDRSPTRRRFLRAMTALASTTSVAGCTRFTRADSGDTQLTTSKPTTSENTTQARVRSHLTRESYLAKAFLLPQDRFNHPKGDSVPLTDLDKEVREAIRTAIDSPPYTTQNGSDTLKDGIDDVHLVAYEDTVWNIDHTFPTVTIHLDTEIPTNEAVEDRTVSYDSDVVRSNDAIAAVVGKIAPIGVQRAPEPFETTHLDPDVQDFLDRYDYIETSKGVGELVVIRTNRSPPHTVRAREATDEELYGRSIRKANDYGPPTRDLINRLLVAKNRKTPTNHQDRIHTIYPDEVPREFARDIDQGSNYVRVDDEFYGFDIRHVHWDDLPIKFQATVLGENHETENPVDIQLSVLNPTENTVQLQMAGIAPFGVLWAYGPDGEQVLWNDGYDQTENVTIENGQVIPGQLDEENLRPGQTQSGTYRLGRDSSTVDEPPKSGTYAVLGTIWAKWPPYEDAKKYDWRSQLFPYTLTIEVP